MTIDNRYSEHSYYMPCSTAHSKSLNGYPVEYHQFPNPERRSVTSRRTSVLYAEERNQDREHDQDDRGPQVDLETLAGGVRLVGRDESEHEERSREETVCSIFSTLLKIGENDETHR